MNNKGITIIATIITIIVMLILAGVSISLVISDRGVITKSQEGAIKTKLASIETDIELAINSVQTDYIKEVAKNPSLARKKIEVVDTFDVRDYLGAYFTIARLNSYLSECKILCNPNGFSSTGAGQKLGIDLKTDIVNIRGSKKYTCNEETDLITLCKYRSNLSGTPAAVWSIHDDGTSIGREKAMGKDYISGVGGYIPSVGYVCNYLFFSNSSDGKNLGDDLYIAIIHFEEFVPVLDDIGIATNTPSECTVLYQGMRTKTNQMIYENCPEWTYSNDNVKVLNPVWLNSGIGESLFEDFSSSVDTVENAEKEWDDEK